MLLKKHYETVKKKQINSGNCFSSQQKKSEVLFFVVIYHSSSFFSPLADENHEMGLINGDEKSQIHVTCHQMMESRLFSCTSLDVNPVIR